MRKEMLNRLKRKYIFVDIDGTLAEYRFNNHVSAKDGSGNGQTMEEIEDHVFLKSRPLKSVIKTLKKAKHDGIWICGALASPIELEDKIVWLKENCKEIEFNGYFWWVPEEYWKDFCEYYNTEEKECYISTMYGQIHRDLKNDTWNWIEEHNMMKLDKIVFIDDRLEYVRYAEEQGVESYHISSFIK